MEVKIRQLTIKKVLDELEQAQFDPHDEESLKVLNIFRELKEAFGEDMEIELSMEYGDGDA